MEMQRKNNIELMKIDIVRFALNGIKNERHFIVTFVLTNPESSQKATIQILIFDKFSFLKCTQNIRILEYKSCKKAYHS